MPDLRKTGKPIDHSDAEPRFLSRPRTEFAGSNTLLCRIGGSRKLCPVADEIGFSRLAASAQVNGSGGLIEAVAMAGLLDLLFHSKRRAWTREHAEDEAITGQDWLSCIERVA